MAVPSGSSLGKRDLARRDQRYGVMEMLNKGDGRLPFTDRDKELLVRFGTQATIAIHNAQLFEQMVASSGLYAKPEVRRDWNTETNFSIDFLDVGTGIATDDDTIGTVGDARFHDFTVIGPAVNLASALVHAARDGRRILCDMLTYASLRDKALVRAKGPSKFKPDKQGPFSGLAYDVYDLEPVEEVAAPSEAGGTYDVFFSYRREGGSHVARSVQQAIKDGFEVFLDVDRLGTGHFDTKLLDTIRSSPNFVVFLSAQSLDRCAHADDWLRKEIAEAIRARRNIIPVTLPGFEFPPAESLPEDIREIARHDAVEYSHRYFQAMIDRIRERLRRRSDTPGHM